MELIAESLTGNLETLSQYESSLAEGARGEVRVYVSQDLEQQQLDDIENQLLTKGVVLTGHVVQDARTVIIPFQKAIAPLLIIGLIVGGLGLIGSTVLGWQIFSDPLGFKLLGIPWYVWGIGAVALMYLFFKSDTGKAATGTAITAGKLYITKGMLKNPKKKIAGKWATVCKQCGVDVAQVGQCNRCRYCLNCCKCTIGGKGKYAYSDKGYKVRQSIIEKELFDSPHRR